MLSITHALSGYHKLTLAITPVGITTAAAKSAHAHHLSAYSRDRNPQTDVTSSATKTLWTKKCPRTTTALAPTAKTSVPAATNPISSCRARRLRSVNRAAESGTDAMIACQVDDSSSVASSVSTGSSNSSLPTVSPGAGIGGNAIRATATVSLAALVTTNKPKSIATGGTQRGAPYP